MKKARIGKIMCSRIAIFGLTGDPFTVAHREICRLAMKELPIHKLYVIN